jgi:uncharacterized membrane protein YqgA involved in biofilm formation
LLPPKDLIGLINFFEMNSTIKNILAVITGIVLGSIINMGTLMLGHVILPPPGDTSTMEALEATMHLFTPKDFLFPFIGHAGGTLAGAFLAAKIAAKNKKVFAFTIGGLFLIGGISMVLMMPSPVWFTIVDLVGAYIPMAFIGWRIAK